MTNPQCEKCEDRGYACQTCACEYCEKDKCKGCPIFRTQKKGRT